MPDAAHPQDPAGRDDEGLVGHEGVNAGSAQDESELDLDLDRGDPLQGGAPELAADQTGRTEAERADAEGDGGSEYAGAPGQQPDAPGQQRTVD